MNHKLIEYYQKLANDLPDDLDNRELLYAKYQERIQELKEEKEHDFDL